MESPSVAVVILNWNGKNFLERFLPSVLKSSYPNFQVIVGDNASTDDSVDFLTLKYPQITIIRNDLNEGFAEGYNRVLRQIEARYFVLLNSDVEVTENWIGPVIETMESDKKIAACQPKIKDWTHPENYEYAGAAGGWIDGLGYAFCRGRVFDTIEKDHGQYDDATDIFWASGAALFIRSDVFKASGGFDPYFFAHMEEIDLCWRIQRMGFRIRFIPQSEVLHVGGGTLKKDNPFKTYLNYRNNLIMMSKNLPTSSCVVKIALRMILDAVSALRLLLQGNFKDPIAIAKAHLSYLKWEWKMLGNKNDSYPKPRSLPCVFSGNVVWQYFVKGKRTFMQIVGVRNG